MKKIVTSWLWWLMPLILGLGRQRQRRKGGGGEAIKWQGCFVFFGGGENVRVRKPGERAVAVHLGNNCWESILTETLRGRKRRGAWSLSFFFLRIKWGQRKKSSVILWRFPIQELFLAFLLPNQSTLSRKGFDSQVGYQKVAPSIR